MQREKLNSLTGLRGIAALIVASMHSLDIWPHLDVTGVIARLGGLAVPFFFCLSGFVMQWTWSQRPTTPFQFLVRRIARIYPTAMLGLLISILAYRLMGNPLGGYAGGHHSVLLSVFLMQSWAFNTPEIRQSWDGVSWSLSCEFFFYIVSPIVLPLVNRLNPRGAFAWLLFFVVGYLLMSTYGLAHWGEGFLVFAPIARLPEYLCGTFLARIVTGRPVRMSNWAPPIVLFVCVVVPLAIAHSVFDAGLSTLDAVALPGFILLIFASANSDLDARHSGGIFTNRPLMFLGKISFSFYMTHALVLGVVSWLSKHGTTAPMSVAGGEAWRIAFLISATCVATVVCLFFEDPMHNFVLRCASRLTKSKPVPASGAGTA
jgi:peptidoglycan/LPS O-acetylase OafA/YrhL